MVQLAQRIKDAILPHPQPFVQGLLELEIVFRRARRRHLDHEIGGLAHFPQLVPIAILVRHAERHEDVRRHRHFRAILLVVQQQIDAHERVRGLEVPGPQHAVERVHRASLPTVFRHRLAILAGVEKFRFRLGRPPRARRTHGPPGRGNCYGLDDRRLGQALVDLLVGHAPHPAPPEPTVSSIADALPAYRKNLVGGCQPARPRQPPGPVRNEFRQPGRFPSTRQAKRSGALDAFRLAGPARRR